MFLERVAESSKFEHRENKGWIRMYTAVHLVRERIPLICSFPEGQGHISSPSLLDKIIECPVNIL